jgi:hypothetical protein
MPLHPRLSTDNAAQVLGMLAIRDVCKVGRVNRAMQRVVSTSSVAWTSPVTLVLDSNTKMLKSMTRLPRDRAHPCARLILEYDRPGQEPAVEFLLALVHAILIPRFTRVRHLSLVGASPHLCGRLYPYLTALAPRLKTLELRGSQWTAQKEWRLQMIFDAMPPFASLTSVRLQHTGSAALQVLLSRTSPAMLTQLVVQGLAEYELCATQRRAIPLVATQDELEGKAPPSHRAFEFVGQESTALLAAITKHSLRPDAQLAHIHWIGSGSVGDWMAPLAQLGPSVMRLTLEGFVFLSAHLYVVAQLRHVRRLELVNCIQRLFVLASPPEPEVLALSSVRDLTLNYHGTTVASDKDLADRALRLEHILSFFPHIITLRLVQSGPAIGDSQATRHEFATAIGKARLVHLKHLDVSQHAHFHVAPPTTPDTHVDLMWVKRLPPVLASVSVSVASAATLSQQVALFASMWMGGSGGNDGMHTQLLVVDTSHTN